MTNKVALDALCADILAHGVPSATLGAYADEIRRETREEYRAILETVVEQTRRECAEKAVSWVDNNAQPLTGGAFDRLAYGELRAAILGAEPAQDDGKPECEESKDDRLRTKQQLGAGCHDECGALPEEDL